MIFFIFFIISIVFAVNHNHINLLIYFVLFSICAALIYIFLDAPDVAITESSIGAAMSTVVMLCVYRCLGVFMTNRLDGKQISYDVLQCFRKDYFFEKIMIFILFSLLFLILVFVCKDIVQFSNDRESLLHSYIAWYYITEAKNFSGIPNVVTIILASFRGFDTLLETTVVFLASIGIVLHVK